MSSNGSLRNVGGNKALPKFGLILKGKNAPSSSKPTSTPGKTSFTFTKRVSSKNALGAASDSDADDLDADGDVPISDFSLGAANAGKSVSEQRKVNKELRAVQAQKERQAEEAQRKAMEEDPTVYDYDAVYDDLKEAENEKKRGIDNPSGGVAKKARYMEGLMRAAAQRKLDLERADERKAQREREEEGEQFGDKERFVTSAFKQKQEELRRLEEEEKRREELEGDVTKKSDLTGFYREILNRNERSPIPILPKPKAEPSSPPTTTTPPPQQPPQEDLDDLRKTEAIKSGLVKLNDSSEVIDKRQLLVGGLNVTARLQKRQAEEKAEREREEREYLAKKAAEEEQRRRELERQRVQKEQRARSRALVVQQREELEREKEGKKEEETKELEQKLARHTTEEVVMDARARYLARKKAQAATKEESDSD